jgi:transcriptional regulator with XRE-family HTH domain
MRTSKQKALERRDRAMQAIGARLRDLRIGKGLTFAEAADGIEHLTVSALCEFETGRNLRRLHRHAPALAAKLGHEIYALAFSAINVLVAADEEASDFDREVAAAFEELTEPGVRPTFGQVADRLGLLNEEGELDLVDANRLAEAVQRIGALRGWAKATLA